MIQEYEKCGIPAVFIETEGYKEGDLEEHSPKSCNFHRENDVLNPWGNEQEASPLKRTWQGLGWLQYLSQRLGVHIPSCFQYCNISVGVKTQSFVLVCEIPVSEHDISFLWVKSVKCLSLSGEIKSWILLLSEFHLGFSMFFPETSMKKWAILVPTMELKTLEGNCPKSHGTMEGLRRHHRGYRGWNMLELSSGSVRDSPVWLMISSGVLRSLYILIYLGDYHEQS